MVFVRTDYELWYGYVFLKWIILFNVMSVHFHWFSFVTCNLVEFFSVLCSEYTKCSVLMHSDIYIHDYRCISCIYYHQKVWVFWGLYLVRCIECMLFWCEIFAIRTPSRLNVSRIRNAVFSLQQSIVTDFKCLGSRCTLIYCPRVLQ